MTDEVKKPMRLRRFCATCGFFFTVQLIEEKEGWKAECDFCQKHTDYHETKEQAIRAWNDSNHAYY